MARYAVPFLTSLSLLGGATAVVVVGAGAPSTPASAAAANSARVEFAGAADADAVPVVRRYSYGEDKRNRLDVYLPPAVAESRYGAALTPTVILVHGGSWTHGDKAGFAAEAQQLVREGYVAIAVNYRFAQDAPWPAQRTDVRKAIRWVRAHDKGLHVDADKIVVLGSSAGGEIAAAALTQGNGSRYARGLVTLSAPSDLALVAANTTHTKGSAALAKIVTRDLLRCVSSFCSSLFEKRSAAAGLDRKDPPSLVFASEDEWVDPLSTIRFRQAARAQGLKSTLVMMPGDRHGMYYWDDAWPTIRAWIAKRMAA